MHNDAAARELELGLEAPLERCGATSPDGGQTCELHDGHPGPHSTIGAPGRPGVTWAQELEELEDLEELYRAPPWWGHTFPEKGIAWKVSRASRPWPCSRIAVPPAGHTPTIDSGAQYVRVSLKPGRQGPGSSFRSRPLCRACALDYGLATLKPPPPRKRKAAR